MEVPNNVLKGRRAKRARPQHELGREASGMNLDTQFLEWYSERASGSLIEGDPMFRAYEIWRHARSRLSENSSDLDRIDAITALRRAVNHRLKSIRSTYNFDCLPSVAGKRQILERLHEFGIVRSAIIKDLFEVRNLIEHEDSDPPDLERCQHYVDIVWYFLKSTDNLLDVRNDEISFKLEEQFVEVTVDYADNWSIRINANLLPEHILKVGTLNSIVVRDYVSKPVRRVKGMRWITGRATLADHLLIRLARGCFSAVGYWHDDA